MKKFTLLFTVLFAAFVINAQNVAINNDGSTAATSAMLDVKSTTKGFMMPRVTSAQRTAIASPVLGLLVFDTDTKTIWAFNGSSWSNLTSAGGGSLTLPFAQTVNVTDPVFQLENNGTGNVMMIRNNSSGVGLHLFSNNGVGIDVSSINNIGIKATSSNSNAIHAYTDNLNNTIPTIRANNFGGGPGLWANSAVDNGAYGTTAGIGKSGLRGDGTGESSNGVFGATTSATGNGVSGFNAGGVGVLGTSTSNYGVKGVTNTATGAAGVHGQNTGSAGSGVVGVSHAPNTQGVYGSSQNGIAVRALGDNYRAVQATSIGGTALYGSSTTGYALETNGKIKIAGGNTNPSAGAVLTSDANGNATWQQPNATPKIAFKAAGIADDLGFPNLVPSSLPYSPGELLPTNLRQKVEFLSLGYDFGNVYSLYSGTVTDNSSTFTVPMTGLYHFDAAIEFLFATTFDYREVEISLMLKRNGVISELTTIGSYINDVDNTVASLSTDVTLLSGDKIFIAARQLNLVQLPSLLAHSYPRTFFNGHLVFAFGN